MANEALYEAKGICTSLETREKFLQSVIAQKEKDLRAYPSRMPAGTIYAKKDTRSHKKEEYYYRASPDDKHGRYIKKSEMNMELIRLLIQREYDQKILLEARKEYDFVRKVRRLPLTDPLMAVFNSMGSIKQKWITPVVLDDERYIDKWKEEKKKPEQPFKKENQMFITKQNEMVRSKSELVIANMLFDKNIPYCYEVPLIDGGNTWCLPDFTVLNVRTRKEYYWEHFGMFGDQNYAINAVKKIRNYEKHGLLQGISTIFTFESTATPLDITEVEFLIQTFLK